MPLLSPSWKEGVVSFSTLTGPRHGELRTCALQDLCTEGRGRDPAPGCDPSPGCAATGPAPGSANTPYTSRQCSGQQRCVRWAREKGVTLALIADPRLTAPAPPPPRGAHGSSPRSVAADRGAGRPQRAARTRLSTSTRAIQKAAFVGGAGQAPSLNARATGRAPGARVFREASGIREVGTEPGRDDKASGVPTSPGSSEGSSCRCLAETRSPKAQPQNCRQGRSR